MKFVFRSVTAAFYVPISHFFLSSISYTVAVELRSLGRAANVKSLVLIENSVNKILVKT